MANFKKIADYSGAEKIVSGPNQLKNGRIYIEISSASGGRKKRIYALRDLRGYKLIETVKGKDFFECVYFGAKCTPDFWKRVCGYRIGVRRLKKHKLSVSFYQRK